MLTIVAMNLRFAACVLVAVMAGRAEVFAGDSLTGRVDALEQTALEDKRLVKILYVNSGDNLSGFESKFVAGSATLTSDGESLLDNGGIWGTLPAVVSGDFQIAFDAFNDSNDGEFFILLLKPATNGGLEIRDSGTGSFTPTINIFAGKDFTTDAGFFIQAPALISAESTSFPVRTWTHVTVTRTGGRLKNTVGDQTIALDLKPLGLPENLQVGIGAFVSSGTDARLRIKNISISSPGFDDGVLRVVGSLRAAVSENRLSDAVRELDQITVMDPSPGMEKLTTELRPLLQKTQDDKLAKELKEILDGVTEAVASEQDAKGLDSVTNEISAALVDAGSLSRSAGFDSFRTKLESAGRFVKGWQSYLNDKAADNKPSEANDLRSLLQGNFAFMPLSRPELLKRMAEAEHAAQAELEIRIQIESMDDVPAALDQLQLMQQSGRFSQELGVLQNRLETLEMAHQSFLDKKYANALQQLGGSAYGNPYAVRFAMGGAGGQADGSPLNNKVSQLREELQFQIVAGMLAMPNLPKPQAGETLEDFLARLAESKEKAKDWPGLQQVLEVYQQATVSFGGPPPWLQDDMAGLRAFLIGEKLEAAGQTLDAIRSYRQALATMGKYFPAEPAAEKLKEMQANHGDLYQQALQQPIVPKGP